MKVATQKNEGLQKVADMISEIGTGMLTTPSEAGQMHSRPMQALQIDENGSIWFFTRADAHGKEAGEAGMNLSFADPDSASYVSIAGRSSLLKDRGMIEKLWSPLMKTWFPGGKDDPSLALLRVDVASAEYWDSPSSSMVRLAGLVASSVSGKTVGLGENKTVSNPG